MEKSMQWMSLQELRHELDRTRPAWDELADLDDVLEDGELPALSKDACRHDLILNELLRRPNNGWPPQCWGPLAVIAAFPSSALSAAPLTVPLKGRWTADGRRKATGPCR